MCTLKLERCWAAFQSLPHRQATGYSSKPRRQGPALQQAPRCWREAKPTRSREGITEALLKMMRFPVSCPRLPASGSGGGPWKSIFNKLFKGSLKFKGPVLPGRAPGGIRGDSSLAYLAPCLVLRARAVGCKNPPAGRQLAIRRGGTEPGPSLCINLDHRLSQVHVVLLNTVNKAAVTHN